MDRRLEVEAEALHGQVPRGVNGDDHEVTARLLLLLGDDGLGRTTVSNRDLAHHLHRPLGDRHGERLASLVL